MSKMMDNLARVLDDDEKALGIKGVPLFLVKGGIVPSAQSVLENQRQRRKKILVWTGAIFIALFSAAALLEESTSMISNLFLKEVIIPTKEVDEMRTLHAKAVTYLKDGNFNDGKAILAKLLQKYPQTKSARIDYAYVLRELGEYNNAEKILLGLLTKNPDEIVVLNNLAVLYAKKGDQEKAEKILTRTIALAPNYSDARLNLAFVFEGQRQFGKAIEAFKQYAEISQISSAENQILKERIRRLKSLDASEQSKGDKI